MARSLWYTAPERAEIKVEPLTPPFPGQLIIETHFSAISRGTERLIWSGHVPESEWQRMRAPMQSGDLPFPVKYGYSAAGRVIHGPSEWLGKNTFALHPHQDIFVAGLEQVTCLPSNLPMARATLAANMETALNAIWDSGAGPGDKVVVVGAGIVGLLIAFIAAGLPGTDVVVSDLDPNRRPIAEAFGARFVAANGNAHEAIGDTADVVFHTSASAGGLALAVAACGFEARVIELSWYCERRVDASFGGSFHAKRLQLISSQVGHVATTRRARWSHARRLETAVSLLDDDRLDALVREQVAFEELPESCAEIFSGGKGGLSPVVVYPAAGQSA